MFSAHRRPLSPEQLAATGAWLLAQQKPSGEIPWSAGDKMDPWDHVHSAMGLTVAGHHEAARRAFRYLARTQTPTGGWAAERRRGRVNNRSLEAHHAAYPASGLWHFHLASGDTDFLAKMWPTLERAIDMVAAMQQPCGAIAWAFNPMGELCPSPLLTACSSIYGSLVCAIRIAERLGHERGAWTAALEGLGGVLCDNISRFDDVDLPEPPGRYSMDWYYPVLGGALRGKAARERLLDPLEVEKFITEGVGCRCVADTHWYTVAEASELVLALDACGLKNRAEQILSWMQPLRDEEGAYFTGITHPQRIIWPDGHRTAWTAATVLMAADALAGDSATSSFFRDLDQFSTDRETARPTGTD